MSVRSKILGGFVAVFVIGLILGIVGLISTNRLTEMSQEQYELQDASSGVTNVLVAHYVWRQGLTEAVLSMTPFTGSLDPDTCALGKWKNSDEARKISDSQILSLLAELDDPHDYIHTEAGTIVKLIEAGNRDEAERMLKEKILPRTEEAISILGAMDERYTVLLEDKGLEVVSLGNAMTAVIFALIAAALIASILFAWRIIVSIMKPLRKMANAAETISTGDLDVDVRYPVNDEIGHLAGAFQKMIEATRAQVSVTELLADGDLAMEVVPRSEKDAMNIALQKMLNKLNDMFGGINVSAMQVSSGSQQIAVGAQSLAQGSTEQASAVEELSSTISEVSAKTEENAAIAKEAARLSDLIRDNAEKSNAQMEQLMKAVKEINEASGQIGKIIKIIDELASQTNILALNASVEAARAGSAGRGFAVVAEEVGKLAGKSADAAKNTGALIENSIEKAGLGLNMATQTSASLLEIIEGIRHSAEIVERIAQSSDEQAAAIRQINTGIDQVAQVVQQNSATAEESAAASEEMNGQSDALAHLVSQFKLRNTDSAAQTPDAHARGKVLPMSQRVSFEPGNVHFGKY